VKIFIHSHYYLPGTRAGAEIFLHEIAKHLLRAGHEILVTVNDDTAYDYEGVQVTTNRHNIAAYYMVSDIVITHLQHAETAIELGALYGRPVVHLLHNNDPAGALKYDPPNNYVVYNSEALRRELHLNLPGIVGRPVIFPDHWRNQKDHYYNEFVTLVNCCVEKGGLFLQQLADAMPGIRFMGVLGAYNTQIVQNSRYRNIQFMPVQTDMRIVYDQTRLIIIPSYYESWSLTASEAMASGIPVICNDMPGLRENCGAAAIYCSGNVVPEYRVA